MVRITPVAVERYPITLTDLDYPARGYLAEGVVSIPRGSKILNVALEHHGFFCWVLEPIEKTGETSETTFVIMATGQRFDYDFIDGPGGGFRGLKYICSLPDEDGTTFHVFERMGG